MNYGQIRTQFLNILNRSDCTDALADTFIEQGIQRSQRLLHIITMERIDSVTVGAVFTGIDIPSDFIKPIAVYRESGTTTPGYKLERVSLAEYLDMPVTSGGPNIWTRDQNKILLKPTPAEDDVIKLLYYGQFEAFTGDSDTTPMSVIAPQLFIYGGLVFAGDYFLDERVPVWEQKYTQVVAELQAQSDDEELAGGAVMQPAYYFPYEDY